MYSISLTFIFFLFLSAEATNQTGGMKNMDFGKNLKKLFVQLAMMEKSEV